MRQHDDPRKRRTREILKETALELLARVGPEGLSIVRLCEEAGVARSTFYEHYQAPWEPAFAALQDRFLQQFPDHVGSESILDPETLLAAGKPLTHPRWKSTKSSSPPILPER